jgi:hypothetical protein
MQLMPYQGTTYKGAQNVRILESWVSGLWIWNGQQYSGRGSCPEGLDNVNTFSVMLRQIIDNVNTFSVMLRQIIDNDSSFWHVSWSIVLFR